MSQIRKELVWNIKRSLFKLSGANLHQIAKDIATDSSEVDQLSATDEEECMDCIISYMQSGTLVGSEDEGLGKLLMLNDVIGKIIEAELPVTATTPVETSTSPPPPPSDQTSPSTNPHVTNAAMPSHLHSILPVHQPHPTTHHRHPIPRSAALLCNPIPIAIPLSTQLPSQWRN